MGEAKFSLIFWGRVQLSREVNLSVQTLRVVKCTRPSLDLTFPESAGLFLFYIKENEAKRLRFPCDWHATHQAEHNVQVLLASPKSLVLCQQHSSLTSWFLSDKQKKIILDKIVLYRHCPIKLWAILKVFCVCAVSAATSYMWLLGNSKVKLRNWVFYFN